MNDRVAQPGGAKRERARVVVLGGGFGGAYTALYLERLRAGGAPVEVALVNRENYLVFQPMLAFVGRGRRLLGHGGRGGFGRSSRARRTRRAWRSRGSATWRFLCTRCS